MRDAAHRAAWSTLIHEIEDGARPLSLDTLDELGGMPAPAADRA